MPHATCSTWVASENEISMGEECDSLFPVPSCPNDPSPHMKRRPVSVALKQSFTNIYHGTNQEFLTWGVSETLIIREVMDRRFDWWRLVIWSTKAINTAF